MLEDLSSDLLHEIVLHITTRKDLLNFGFLTCHKVYDTVLSHPNSILRSVISTELGIDAKVLPLAWRNARLLELCDEADGVDESPDENWLNSNEDLTINCLSHQIRRLEAQHNVLKTFEKTFSRRCKDSRKAESCLTLEESRRFQLCAYTFNQYQILFSAAFCPRHGSCHLLEDSKAVQYGTSLINFMRNQPVTTLARLAEFNGFLEKVSEIAMRLSSFQVSETSQKLNLKYSQEKWRNILSLFLMSHCDRLSSLSRSQLEAFVMIASAAPIEYWFSKVHDQVIHEKSIFDCLETPEDSRILLAHGDIIDQCPRCGINLDIEFFNDSNFYDAASRFWTEIDLPGRLRNNPIERNRIRQRVYGTAILQGDTQWLQIRRHQDRAAIEARVAILNEVAEHARMQGARIVKVPSTVSSESENEESQAPVATYRWRTSDPLCRECFKTVIQEAYYRWWIDERETDRVVEQQFQEKCWWGLDCNTQRHIHHANRLDHCCPKVGQPIED